MNAIYKGMAQVVSRTPLPWLIAVALLSSAIVALALAAWLGFGWALVILCLLMLSGCGLGPRALTRLTAASNRFYPEPENRFKTAMKGAALGFWDSDRRTGETYRDAFWFDLLEIPESDRGYRHDDWFERVAPEERERVMATFKRRLKRKGDFVELDYRIRKWDGRYMWVQDRARVLEIDENGKPTRIVGVMQEVTRRKQVELELEKARNAAVQANQTRDHFIACISHEIRTPLNAIIGMASFLTEAELPEADKEQVRIIYRSALSLLEMIDTLLDFSRVQAGKIALNVEEFPPRAVVAEVTELFKIQALEKGLHINVHIGAEVPELIEGDVIRIRQLLSNLLSNAIKFSNKGSIDVEVRILREVDLPTKAKAGLNARSHFLQGLHHNYLYIGLRDEGIGIPRYAEREIFDAFSQVEGSAQKPKAGSGLGLAICAQIVKAMGGAIWVDSIFGQGSHFQFVVRVGVACFLNESAETPGTTSAAQQRVLVVGYPHAEIAAVQNQFEALGLRVRTMSQFASVTEETVMRNPFALVVSLNDGKQVHVLMRLLSRIPGEAKPERLIGIESSSKKAMQPEEAMLLGFEYVLPDLQTLLDRLKSRES